MKVKFKSDKDLWKGRFKCTKAYMDEDGDLFCINYMNRRLDDLYELYMYGGGFFKSQKHYDRADRCKKKMKNRSFVEQYVDEPDDEEFDNCFAVNYNMYEKEYLGIKGSHQDEDGSDSSEECYDEPSDTESESSFCDDDFSTEDDSKEPFHHLEDARTKCLESKDADCSKKAAKRSQVSPVSAEKAKASKKAEKATTEVSSSDQKLLNSKDAVKSKEYMVYTKILEIGELRPSLENFQLNKPLCKLILDEHQTDGMNKNEKRTFFARIFVCPLFKRDGLK